MRIPHESRIIASEAGTPYLDRIKVGLYSQAQTTNVYATIFDYFKVAIFSTSETNKISANHICVGFEASDTRLADLYGNTLAHSILIKKSAQVNSIISNNYIDKGYIEWSADQWALNTRTGNAAGIKAVGLSGLSFVNNFMLLGLPGTKNMGDLNPIYYEPQDRTLSCPKRRQPFALLKLRYPSDTGLERMLTNFNYSNNLLFMGGFSETPSQRTAMSLKYLATTDNNPVQWIDKVTINNNGYHLWASSTTAIDCSGNKYAFERIEYPTHGVLEIKDVFNVKNNKTVSYLLPTMPLNCSPRSFSLTPVSTVPFVMTNKKINWASSVTPFSLSFEVADYNIIKNNNANIKYTVSCDAPDTPLP